MRKQILFLLSACFMVFIQLAGYGQKPPKKLHLLPVYLVYNKALPDTAFDNLVKEAFTRYNIKLIDKKKFDELNEAEVRRIETKFRVRENKFESERDARSAISTEQHFVSNLLFITFVFAGENDSMRVIKASWKATPCPPDINSGRTSGDIDTVLEDTCCSLRDNIFTIVDKILFSKWLR